MRITAWPKSKNSEQNPFQHLLYSSVEKRGKVEVSEFHIKSFLLGPTQDIFHVHWPDVYLALGRGWRFWVRYGLLRIVFTLAAFRGTKVVWTAHNLKRTGQRNSKQLERFFWPWFVGRIDGLIYMTKASQIDAEAQIPQLADTIKAIIPHGHYRTIVEKVGSCRESCKQVDLDTGSKGQYLFFGSITRYKNANKLLKAFLTLPKGMARLAIKGKMSGSSPDKDLQDMLADLPLDRADDVIFDNRFLSDEELVQAIRQSDLVVFPYSDVLNSGAAIFALSVGRPILASDTALFRELQGQVGADWVRLIEGELDAQQLSDALDQARDHKKRGKTPDLSAFDWNHIAEQTVTFYQHVIDAQKGPKA